MFPEDEDVQKVAAHLFDPFEYLMLRHKDGLLKTDFPKPLGKVTYHAACHQRVQNIGQKTRELLALIPETEVTLIERCWPRRDLRVPGRNPRLRGEDRPPHRE